MLDLAITYKKELETIYRKNIIGNSKYKYWINQSYLDYRLEMYDTEWECQYRVSILENKILGLFKAFIKRPEHFISNLSIASFGKNNGIILIKDLLIFIDNIFMEYKFSKINFYMLKGNPAEKIYKKFIKRYGGRKVGYLKNDIKLIDGIFYDNIIYEIMREDYIKNK